MDNKVKDAELMLAWIKLGAEIELWSNKQYMPTLGSFLNYGWDYSPETVLCAITSDKVLYFGLKSILFSGFCTWLLYPEKLEPIRDAMMIKALLKLAQAERRGRRIMPKHKAFGALAGRILFPGIAFYEDFYWPVANEKKWNSVPSRSEHRKILRNRQNAVTTVIDLMEIYHWHALNLRGSPRHKQASLDNGITALLRIRSCRGQRNLHESTYENHWTSLCVTSAMTYAISSLGAEGEHTILEMLLDNRVLYGSFKKTLPEVCCRARFAVQDVIVHLKSPGRALDALKYIPDCKASSIPPPVFSDPEISILRDTFRKFNA